MSKKIYKWIFRVISLLLITLSFHISGNADEPGEYLVKINRVGNCITVYQKDENGEFTKPYKSMVCSVGADMNTTPIGDFTISDKYDWNQMSDGTFSQYCCKIADNIFVSTAPYRGRGNDTLIVEEYNKLGDGSSPNGCIRLNTADAKWIYDNCQPGTKVVIYDDQASPGPMGRPGVIRIPSNSEFANWDPTDPNAGNPWNTKSPQITGAEDKSVKLGDTIEFMDGILGIDTCGNEATDYVKIEGDYSFDEPGRYELKYVLTDLTGRTAEVPFVLEVKGEKKTTAQTEETKNEATTPYVIYEEKEKGNAGVGTVMIIIVVATLSFAVVSFVVKRK